MVAVGCGFLIAFFYDLYWLAAAYRLRARWLSVLQDLLFWLVMFCLVAALWLRLTGGVMRLAVYLWFLGGGFVYRLTLSPHLRRLRKKPQLPPRARHSQNTPAEQYAQGQQILAPPVHKAPLQQLQRLPQLPAQVMLQVGLGFWRSLAFGQAKVGQGQAWLKEHRSKPQPPPEADVDKANGEGTESDSAEQAGQQNLPPAVEEDEEPTDVGNSAPDINDAPWQELKSRWRWRWPGHKFFGRRNK